MDKRIVYTASGLKVREAQGEEGKESRTIEGCAIVFNQETVLYEGANYRESEVILPSCVTMEFLKEQDIKMNLLHDRHSSIARSKKGEGSLNLELREDGLYFSFEAPECDLGDRALALVKNGTYTGCSFEFYSKDYEITEREGNDYLITHKEFKSLTALTIAMDPAYEQTNVNAREEYENGKRRTENGERETENGERKTENGERTHPSPKTHPNPPCEGGGEDAEAEQEKAVREMKARLYLTEM